MAADETHIRLHAFLPCSLANGPGRRSVLWLQGCSLGCRGCFNPASHAETGGKLVPLNRLFGEIASLGAEIEGITLSGGEPLQQLPSVTQLLRRISTESYLSVILFTGYSWVEVQRLNSRKIPLKTGKAEHRVVRPRNPCARQIRGEEGCNHAWERRPQPEILNYVDVLIAGRYNADRRIARGMRGSSNKTIHFLSNRYCPSDIEDAPDSEVILSPSGDLAVTGIDPLS